MNKKIYCIVLVLAVGLVTSTFFIIQYYYDVGEQKKLYENLANIVAETQASENKPIHFLEDKTLLPEYGELYSQNEDMVGWIRIEDTRINYPVMQSMEEPNFYLKHGFDKEYTDYGCPYIQENCDVERPSDNLVIYGHNMKDGTMFAGLMKFKDKSFWEKHKTISFDTLTERYDYEVIVVFKTVVYTNNAEGFKYYEFTDAINEAEFDGYIAKCKELALYDTGVGAKYGDKLITLSTCEYSTTNGRLVIVAKRR